ncbi:AI-2E family transporter [Flavobacterium sp. MAH-1]|uniref:AI-2E family transporter n=1 Tax=Flavobacterium agri TaxID=2743471 RepID=A0A7Y8XZH7_9FLAO|nr:AI-2E family transporter [Flavobacterium agri]NUY79779.1 AI-2E family transporter [Flavobacterium agri]NYA69804.1 AI-2E family transporter [Flavobacterium agri]
MANITKLPFNAKLAYTLLCISLLLGLTYVAQDIIMPVLLALLFAILLRPVARFFRTKLKFPHVIASMASVAVMVLLILGIFILLSYQIADIVNDWDKIKKNCSVHMANLQDYVHDTFNLSKREQNKMIDDATKDSMETGKSIVGSTLTSFSDMLLNLILIPIYTFLFLLYRTHFLRFLAKLIPNDKRDVLEDILVRIKVSVQSYIIGLMIEMVLVSVLTGAGYMIIGLEYAIMLGVLTGLLNLIPYIGITIAGVLAVVASITTNTDFSLVIGVVVVNIVVQLIDNNLLVPLIVSSKVEINAFISIVGIIIGGALGGISGMFLAIPMIAILKVIFDRIRPLEPWGYLFGDDLPKTYSWHRLRLPRYDHDTMETTLEVSGDSKKAKPLFTETTTQNQ